MNRIRELREDFDLKQSDVSKVTGIDQRTLSNYETGKTNPDSYAIIKLADFFGVSADYLLGRNDNTQKTVESLKLHIEKIEKELSNIKKELNKI